MESGGLKTFRAEDEVVKVWPGGDSRHHAALFYCALRCDRFEMHHL